MFNKIDYEITYFAKRYQEDQNKITNEITDIIKNIITPIVEVNTNLRKEVQATIKRIDEINILIIDLTKKSKNKISEKKILITNKIDEINNRMTNTMKNRIKRVEKCKIQTYKEATKKHKKKRHKWIQTR